MPRFVILEHDWPSRHWDLLLESGTALRAWRLLAEPAPGRAVSSEPNTDHRLSYLDHEGPISGGRGVVVQWDRGTFEWLADEPGRCVVALCGQKLRGQVVIEPSATHFG